MKADGGDGKDFVADRTPASCLGRYECHPREM